MLDGYSKTTQELVSRINYMKDIFDEQIKINNDIFKIKEEMEELPELPTNMDSWIDSISIPSHSDKSFKLSDLKRVFQINRQYNKLVEKQEENSQKVRIVVIENLIDRIKSVLDK